MPEDPKKEFWSTMEQLFHYHSRHQVFEDFLDYCLIMFDINKTAQSFAELEQRYTKPEEHRLFAKAMWAMAGVAEGDGTGFYDPFGDFYMEYLSNDSAGQFFTPQEVSDLMARIDDIGSLPDGATVMDPACGSGRCLLSAAKIKRDLKFYGADIDHTCVKMTAINMIINTMPGEVAHMDTLRMEHWRSYNIIRTPTLDGRYIPSYYVTGPGQTKFIQRIKATQTTETVVPQSQPIIKPVPKTITKPQQSGQLFLFDF